MHLETIKRIIEDAGIPVAAIDIFGGFISVSTGSDHVGPLESLMECADRILCHEHVINGATEVIHCLTFSAA